MSASDPTHVPYTSVVIPVRNGAGLIGEQLRALGRQQHRGDWEVVVADNGSTDGTRAEVEACRGSVPRLRLVDAGATAGPSHARNVGARWAAGELLLFADADDIVAAGWLEAMVEALARADVVVGINDPGARVLAPSSPRVSVTGRSVERGGGLPWGRGGNLGVRAEVFRRLGGWDEHRPIGEDVEFCWRSQRAGYRFRVVPSARVHYRQPTRLGSLARRRYAFGRAAPALYREFGLPGRAPSRLVSDVVRLLVRSPFLIASSRLRARWVAHASGVLGRIHGTLALRTASRGAPSGGRDLERELDR